MNLLWLFQAKNRFNFGVPRDEMLASLLEQQPGSEIYKLCLTQNPYFLELKAESI